MTLPPLRIVCAGEGWGGGRTDPAPILTFPRKQGKEA
jgi:hypothetical protein